MTTRVWDIIAIFEDGSEHQLNDAPFVGDSFDAGNEAERLASDLEGVESFVLEGWKQRIEGKSND